MLLASTAFAKPVPEAFPQATLADVTRVQDKLGGRSGVADRENGAVLIVASSRGLSVDGRMIVKLDKGTVDPADKEGGAEGMKLPKLALAVPGTAPVEIAMDRDMTYRLLVELVFSAKQTGRTKLALVVRAGGSVMTVPIALPTTSSLANELDAVKQKKPKKKDLGMIVSVSKTELLVWSFSGLVGTLKKPKLRIALDEKAGEIERQDAAMQLRTALETIAKRWPAAERPAETQAIVLMCDGATPMQFVADLMVAIRPQFSDVALSTGFE